MRSHSSWGAEMVLLHSRFDNLTRHNDWLQVSCHNLSQERDQLRASYNNASGERDQLRARQRELEKLTGKSRLFCDEVMLFE